MPCVMPPITWLSTIVGLIMRPQSWAAAMRRMVTSPVSTSTSTSTHWAPNVRTDLSLGLAPRAPWPRIICGARRPVTSATVTLFAGSPSTQITPLRTRKRSGSSSSNLAAASNNWRLTSMAAARTAGPIVAWVALPALVGEYGPCAVSPRCTITCSIVRPSSSAATWASAVRVPVPMSCVPVITSALPSPLSLIQA